MLSFGGMKVLILNGPNLNLLGKREPSIYGKKGFEEHLQLLREKFPDHEIAYFQSNHEGDLIDRIQEADGVFEGVALNAGGYTHTSVALLDVIKAVEVPVMEVHISNIQNREPFRQHSMIADACVGSVSGMGLASYDMALEKLFSLK